MAAASKKAAAKPEPVKAEPVKTRAARKTQALTLTQATQIEAQFDTFIAKGQSLAEKLVDIESRFENKESFVPSTVAESREKFMEALATFDEAKDIFTRVGKQYREFFG